MTWEQARQRRRLAQDIAADFARKGSRALTEWGPRIEAEFGDLDALLRHVQRRYHVAAEGRLDAVIEASPADPQAQVRAALDEVATVYPDLRRLLDAHEGHPALAEGDARFRESVRAATGVDPSQPRYEEKGTSRDRKPAFRAGLRPVCAWLH
jgi:hypothetical protein